MQKARAQLAVATLVAVLAVGCTVPVAGALDERDANLVADALNRAGIEAAKEPDPAAEGRYQIVVPRGEASPAIAALREHDLPPRHAPGIVDSVGKGALVPSPLAEHAQYVAGLAGDLERSLATVDGILGARVHLSLPAPNPLSERPAEKPTASVLLKHLGATPPLNSADVQRLVAGAVSNLAPDDVTVVMVSRPAQSALPERTMATMGPISVARSSAAWFRGLVVSGLTILVVLSAALLYLWMRLRRTLNGASSDGETT